MNQHSHQNNSQRIVFHDSILPLPELPGLAPNGLKLNHAGPGKDDAPMLLSFSFALPDDKQAALVKAVAEGQRIPYADQLKDFATDRVQCQKLTQWLEQQGYTIDHVASDNSTVYAKASASVIEQSLGVTMVHVTKNGVTYLAARNAPSLPADIAGQVQAIGGLQPFRHARKHSRRMPSMNRTDADYKVNVNGVPAPTSNINFAPPYLPHEIRQAYNADDAALTGRGQTIAILIDAAPDDADLSAFWQRNNIAAPGSRVTIVNVNNTDLPPPEGEETMDVEWAGGVAQEAAIRVYATGSLQFTALDRGLDRILNDLANEPGLRQLSISLGLGESYMQPAELRTQNLKYLRLAAAGVNVFVSSGDAGSNPDNTGHASNGPLQAEYPASDNYVIGVGGTTLKLAASGTVNDETGWPDSGGGKSAYFGAPSWQSDLGGKARHHRMVPDVALAADPNTGALVILGGRDMQFGGTSWSAPVWAAFCAGINGARLAAGKQALTFLPPLMYPLQKTACFRDITIGNNGAFDAVKGYDMVTGLGVPDVAELLSALNSSGRASQSANQSAGQSTKP